MSPFLGSWRRPSRRFEWSTPPTSAQIQVPQLLPPPPPPVPPPPVPPPLRNRALMSSGAFLLLQAPHHPVLLLLQCLLHRAPLTWRANWTLTGGRPCSGKWKRTWGLQLEPRRGCALLKMILQRGGRERVGRLVVGGALIQRRYLLPSSVPAILAQMNKFPW